MDAATAKRLIRLAKETCRITPRASSTLDANENPILVDGSPVDGIDCFLVTPSSVKHAEVSTEEEEGVSITHQLYLPGDVGIDRFAAVSDVRKYRGATKEVTLHAGTLEVVRVETWLLPFIYILNLHEVE